MGEGVRQRERSGHEEASGLDSWSIGRLPGALDPDWRETLPDPGRNRPVVLYRQSLVKALRTMLAIEHSYGHGFYWIPVFLIAGAAWWFSADETPSRLALAVVASVMATVAILAGHARPYLRFTTGVFAFLATGALLADFESARRDVVLLDSPVTTTISGMVLSREADAAGRWRYLIEIRQTIDPVLRRPPIRIHATASAKHRTFGPGEMLKGRVRLATPSGPALPGLNDFAFDAYFDGVGAFGYFYGEPESASGDAIAERGASYPDNFMRGLDNLRSYVSQRIRNRLPGDVGAFASSMVTDDRRAIGKETAENLRVAGLAHIVAISGLNMALAAGLFFVGLRLLLSLSQEVVHRLPVKKIAAAGALATVTGYYLISGFAVSAERAYIMTAIMLLAAIFGRPAISLRNIAISALVIVATNPSAVMGPGFQMSFAATIALVAAYSGWQSRSDDVTGKRPSNSWLARTYRFVSAIFLTSLIGGVSTAIFSAEHFQRIATWGLPANLLAMPVISFVVMPAGLAALLLMPFGLDGLALDIMGKGLEWVIAVAGWIASFKGEFLIGRMPDWFFLGMTIAFLILALLRSRLRIVGAAMMVVLLFFATVLPPDPQPDLVIFEDGALVGLRRDDALSTNRQKPSDFILTQWTRALRIEKIDDPVKLAGGELPPKPTNGRRFSKAEMKMGRNLMDDDLAQAPEGRFACRRGYWCVARMRNGLKLVTVEVAAFAAAACDFADIVVVSSRLKWTECRSGARLYTAETLRRTGSVELFVSEFPTAENSLTSVPSFTRLERPWLVHRTFDWRTGMYLNSATD
jgi:ComEC/Rec2-related protein